MFVTKVKNTSYGNRRYRGTVNDTKPDETGQVLHIPKARTYGADAKRGSSYTQQR